MKKKMILALTVAPVALGTFGFGHGFGRGGGGVIGVLLFAAVAVMAVMLIAACFKSDNK
jgi:uncharacterized membrane protein